MLVNNVTVNSDFIAKPAEEIRYNDRFVDVYNLFKRTDEADYYRGKVFVRARSPRRVVIEKSIARIEQLRDE